MVAHWILIPVAKVRILPALLLYNNQLSAKESKNMSELGFLAGMAAITAMGGIDIEDIPQVKSTEKFDPIRGNICGHDMGRDGHKKQERNARCQCGSGFKAKKCCVVVLPTATKQQWKSIAVWPDTIKIANSANNESSDTHDTEDQAIGVCTLLMRDGFGGEKKVFPLSVRTEPV